MKLHQTLLLAAFMCFFSLSAMAQTNFMSAGLTGGIATMPNHQQINYGGVSSQFRRVFMYFSDDLSLGYVGNIELIYAQNSTTIVGDIPVNIMLTVGAELSEGHNATFSSRKKSGKYLFVGYTQTFLQFKPREGTGQRFSDRTLAASGVNIGLGQRFSLQDGEKDMTVGAFVVLSANHQYIYGVRLHYTFYP